MGGHAAWLASRVPVAPPALVRCVQETFAAHPEWEGLDRTAALVEAAGALRDAVLRGAPASRDSALLLLAADACVTYAFEAAADAPATLVARARQAERQLARFDE